MVANHTNANCLLVFAICATLLARLHIDVGPIGQLANETLSVLTA